MELENINIIELHLSDAEVTMLVESLVKNEKSYRESRCFASKRETHDRFNKHIATIKTVINKVRGEV